MTGWFGLAVVALAAYRITRVVTTDSITEHARNRLYRWAWVEPDEPAAYEAAAHMVEARAPGTIATQGAGQPLPRHGGGRTYANELFNCPWCLGVWVSYAVLAFWSWVVLDGTPVDRYLVLGAAVAGVQGFLASRSDA